MKLAPLLALLLISPAFAQEDFKALVERQQKHFDAIQAHRQKAADKVKEELLDTGMNELMADYLAWRALFAAKTKQPKVQLPPFQLPLKKDRLGQVSSLRTIQIVDEQNLIGEVTIDELRYSKVRTGGGLWSPTDVWSTRPTKETVWISGFNTQGMVDDKTYRPAQVFRVKGTRRYTTALGSSKTVFELVPFDVRGWERHFEEPVDLADFDPPENKERPADKEESRNYRTWTDSTGEFKVEAEFFQFHEGKVWLRLKEDGTVIKVDPTKLSKADQKWYRDELRRRKETADGEEFKAAGRYDRKNSDTKKN